MRKIRPCLTSLEYKDILDHVSDGVYFVDCDRRILYWNKGAETISGYSPDEVIGKMCYCNILRHVDENGSELCLGRCPLARTIEDGQKRQANVFLHHKAGHRLPVRVHISPLRDETGAIVGAVETFSDNSAQLDALERIDTLTSQSLTDSLTGLGNRRYCDIALDARVEETQRYGWTFSVIMADIDEFKEVNDAYGHPMGDKVLRMVATTLARGCRSFDFVGRFGGEEFLLVMPNVRDMETLRETCERLRKLVAGAGISHRGEEIRVTLSMGGVVAHKGQSRDELIKRADTLLYAAKEAGRDRVILEG